MHKLHHQNNLIRKYKTSLLFITVFATFLLLNKATKVTNKSESSTKPSKSSILPVNTEPEPDHDTSKSLVRAGLSFLDGPVNRVMLNYIPSSIY